VLPLHELVAGGQGQERQKGPEGGERQKVRHREVGEGRGAPAEAEAEVEDRIS
jgi:hypothetical protein